MQSTGSTQRRQNFGQAVTMPPIVGDDGVQREYVFRGRTPAEQQDIESLGRQLNRLSLQNDGIVPRSAMPEDLRQKFDGIVENLQGERVVYQNHTYPAVEVRETGAVSFEAMPVSMAPSEVVSAREWEGRVSMVTLDVPPGTTARVTFEDGSVGNVPMGGHFRFYWQGVPPRDLGDFVARASECLVENNDGMVGTWTGVNPETGRMMTVNINVYDPITHTDEQAALLYNMETLLSQRPDLASIHMPVTDEHPANVRPRHR